MAKPIRVRLFWLFLSNSARTFGSDRSGPLLGSSFFSAWAATSERVIEKARQALHHFTMRLIRCILLWLGSWGGRPSRHLSLFSFSTSTTSPPFAVIIFFK